MMKIGSLLNLARQAGASDLHLIVPSPPLVRVDGALMPMEGMPPLSEEDVYQAFTQITTPEQQETFSRQRELDFAHTLPGVGRLRCNACQQRGTIGLNFRLLALKVPTIDELGLPQMCKDLILKPRGLIIVTGPTGSGKTTTLAAMIQYLNTHRQRYIITVEDPIEYVHSNMKSAVSQRELGGDTLSFASALKHVLRQDPDVILVGEMRDVETAAAVLTVAETGHLVLSTGHAPSAAQSVDRVIDLFPPHERHLAQMRLATVILGILCQVLAPRASGSGRVAAIEVMLGIPPVRNLIREGKSYLLPNIIRTHSQLGMCTLDEALVSLYLQGAIDWQAILDFCQDAEEAQKLVGEVRVR